MSGLGLFQSAIGGLKLAADGVKALGKLHTMAEVEAKAIELHGVILSAQASAFAAQSEQLTLLG